MKKVLAIVLVVVLILGVAGPAAAKSVLSAPISKTVPDLAEEHESVKMHNRDDIMKLSDDVQNLMEKAGEELKYVDTKGLALKYFFYMDVSSDKSFVSVVFDPIPHHEILFMQYIDGTWVELEHSIAADKTITVAKVETAPFAIFTDGMDSPGGQLINLLPILTDESYLIVQLHTPEEVVTLSEDVQNRMAEAKANLKNACPANFAVKYFFEMEILGTEAAVDVDFEPIKHSEIAFKQYVDGAWMELEYSIKDGGIITVSGLLNGPVAVFVK